MSGEIPVVFACCGEQLIGIVHRPRAPGRIGVIIIVGGPQYRVGSHRQFVLLARSLAERGHPVLRFDCRGMGDSNGESGGFEQIGADIAAAIDHLSHELPGLDGVVLWGLCDAASAALLYAADDRRVAGLVLLNPWARSEVTLARTYLRHYYLSRLISRDFWRKILTGRFVPAKAFGDLAVNLHLGAGTGVSNQRTGFIDRMLQGLSAFRGPVLLILSGNDLTAAEFCDVAKQPEWRAALARPTVTQYRMEEANHTFSTAAWRDEVASRSIELVEMVAMLSHHAPER